MKPIDAGRHLLETLSGQRERDSTRDGLFVESTKHLISLHEKGLITDKEFVDVTKEDMRRWEL